LLFGEIISPPERSPVQYQCHYCNYISTDPDHQFCKFCGRQLAPTIKTRYCPACGYDAGYANYCPRCRCQLSQIIWPPPPIRKVHKINRNLQTPTHPEIPRPQAHVEAKKTYEPVEDEKSNMPFVFDPVTGRYKRQKEPIETDKPYKPYEFDSEPVSVQPQSEEKEPDVLYRPGGSETQPVQHEPPPEVTVEHDEPVLEVEPITQEVPLLEEHLEKEPVTEAPTESVVKPPETGLVASQIVPFVPEDQAKTPEPLVEKTEPPQVVLFPEDIPEVPVNIEAAPEIKASEGLEEKVIEEPVIGKRTKKGIICPCCKKRIKDPEATECPNCYAVIHQKPKTIKKRTPEPKSTELPLVEAQTPQKLGFEENIGIKWFSWIGIISIFVAVAFFLKYVSDKNMIGPEAKIGMGIAGGMILIVLGFYFNRREAEKIFQYLSTALIGGGYAVLFLVTYVAFILFHLLPESVDFFILMALVEIAVISAALLNSQVIAAEAFLLGYLIPFIGTIAPYSVIFIVLLTTGLVILIKLKGWLILGICGLFATYGIMYYWIRGHNDPENFGLNLSVLSYYMGMFILLAHLIEERPKADLEVALIKKFLSIFHDTDGSEKGVAILLLSSKINYVLILMVVWTNFEDQTGLASGIISTLFIALSVLSCYYNLRGLMATYLTMSFIFITLTIPLQLHGGYITIAWAIEAFVYFNIGYYTRSPGLRAFSHLLAVLVLFKALAVDTSLPPVNHAYPLESLRAIVFLTAIIIFTLTAYQSRIRAFKKVLDKLFGWFYLAGAVMLITVIAGLELRGSWVTLTWSVEAMVLLVIGFRYGPYLIRIFGNLVNIAVVFKLFMFDVFLVKLNSPDQWIIETLRIFSFFWPILFYCLTSWLYYRLEPSNKNPDKPLVWVYLLGAVVILTILLNLELNNSWVTLAWSIEGLVLMTLGIRYSLVYMRGYGHLVNLLVMITTLVYDTFLVKLNSDEERTLGTLRLFGYLWPIVFFSLTALMHSMSRKKNKDFDSSFSWIYLSMAVSLLTILLGLELNDAWITAAWSIEGIVLMALGIRYSAVYMRGLGTIVNILVLIKTLVIDTSLLKLNSDAELTLGTLRIFGYLWPIVLFSLTALMYSLSRSKNKNFDSAYDLVYLIMAVSLLTILLGLELDGAWITLAWTLEGFGLLLIGLYYLSFEVRALGHIINLIVFIKVLILDSHMTRLSDPEGFSLGTLRVFAYLGPLVFFSLLASIYQFRKRIAGSKDERSDLVYTLAPAVLLSVLLGLELPRAWLTMGWFVEALVFLILGAFVSERFKLYGNVIASITMVKLFLIDSFGLYKLAPDIAPGELLLTAYIPAILFLCLATIIHANWPTKYVYELPQGREDWADNMLWTFLEKDVVPRFTGPTWRIYMFGAVLATSIYAALELQNELISIAWTLEAIVILMIGFGFKNGYVRTIGMGLFIITILKVFTIDVSKLETIFRILSFLVLGAILLGVSYLYSKYRHKLK
jgi:uncharacterized membrane protein